jgi:hypothetical protein
VLRLRFIKEKVQRIGNKGVHGVAIKGQALMMCLY